MNQSRNNAPSVAIVGASGAVGKEFLDVLAQRQFPIGQLKLLASERSSGKTVPFNGQTHTIERLTPDSFHDVDLALFSAGGDISREFAPIASAAGATVIDNSSAFRMTPDVPLVVPEVNPEAVQGIKPGDGRIIANPNCSTIIMIVPVTPLYRAAGIRRMVISTYQAASGAGAAAMAELEQQTREVLEGQNPTCNIFSQQYAFNLFSHDSTIQPNGYNAEELKMINETRKIWGLADNDPLAISTTCVRVPVMRAHAESLNLTLERPLDRDQTLDILSRAPGVAIIDDASANRYPTPLDATGKDDIYVGRIRNELGLNGSPNPNGLNLFVCGDQLRKGAALNAVQIAELLID